MIEKVLLDKIVPNPFNARKEYDSDSIAGLAQEMKANGVFGGALRGRRVNGSIELCYGHRRLRAMKKAGIRHAEVIVENLTDEQMEIQSLIENLQRVDLGEIEKADAVAKLCQTRTQKEVAKLLGLSTSRINQLYLASSLPQSLKEAVSAGKIGGTTATIAHRLAGTGFAEKIQELDIPEKTVQKIAGEIGRIKNKTVREKVKQSAANGHVKSAADVVKKAIQYSKPKAGETIQDISGLLMSAELQLNYYAEIFDELVPAGYSVQLSPSWKDFYKKFSRLSKAVEAIAVAKKPAADSWTASTER